MNTGSDYDIVSPPRLTVSQDGHSGIGASVIAQVEGALEEVLITNEGSDFDEVPDVKIIGGNNTTAIVKAKMKFVNQVVEFDATSTGGVVRTSPASDFFFPFPHNFKAGEQVIYETGGTTPIGIGVTPGTLVDTAPYFVVKRNPDDIISLADNREDALAGIGTIPLTTNGGGIQRLRSVDRRLKVDKILVEDAGFFKNREIRTSTGINTFTDTILSLIHI